MTFKKLTEATKTKYTEADFAWDEKAMIAEYKAAVLDYMNGASMDDALKAIKAMLKSGGETIVKGKGPVRESRAAKIAKLKLHEEFKLYENMWEEAGKPYRISCTDMGLADAIALDRVPVYLKNVKEVELIDWDRVPVKKYNQICKFLHELGIKVTKGASGREPSKKLKEALDDKEYSVVYRLRDWSVSQPDDEAFLDAETAADAIDFFMEYMLDPDNLDDDIDPADIITEDDIIIISVAPTGA
jgi:hypothetical protein